MITPTDLARLQPLVAEAGVDGWLLFDFRGRNPIAAAVLGPEIVGSRRVYVLIPPTGLPIALVHAVDAELWRAWPSSWPKRVWVTREQLAAELGTLVRGKRLAVDWSPDGAIPYLDGVPLGVAELLRSLGATLVPSAELVTRYCSVWSAADVASHRRAAEAIAAIAREALALAGSRAATAEPLNEHALAVWVRERFDRAGLVTESGPSVSWGPNAARAHYDPTPEESAPIVRGAMLLLDLWATEPGRDLCGSDLDGGDRPSDRSATPTCGPWCDGRGTRRPGPDPFAGPRRRGRSRRGGGRGGAARSSPRPATPTARSRAPATRSTATGCTGSARRSTTPRPTTIACSFPASGSRSSPASTSPARRACAAR